jgi:hypothetical protein
LPNRAQTIIVTVIIDICHRSFPNKLYKGHSLP